MRLSCIAVLLGVAACGFEGKGNGLSSPDAATPDSPSQLGCTTWTPFDGVMDPCSAALEMPVDLAISAADATYNTTTGDYIVGGITGALPGMVMTRASGGSLRIVNLKSLQVAAGRKLTLTGTNAVLFLVHGDVTITGTIDASAARPVDQTTSGPGAESALCSSGTPTSLGKVGSQSDNANKAGGGGGGGAFGDDGGDGGDGEGAIAKGARGALSSDNLPLRGGCAGGRGGDNNNNAANEGGLAGGGGGAVGISARGAISVTGKIQANGASGLGAKVTNATGGGGGGGGGSGGTVALDGRTVSIGPNAGLCANGGAGGEGSSSLKDGNPGTDATCTTAVALGGKDGTATAGDGGDGGAGLKRAGSNGKNGTNSNGVEGGGGGGGGGVGRILLRSRTGGVVNNSTAVSPQQVILP
jgi:hypothetical protein